MVAFGALWAGWRAVEELRGRVRAAEAVIDGLELLEGELWERGTALPELLEDLSSRTREPASALFSRCARACRELDRAPFGDSWRRLTAELAEKIGSYDSVEIVNELKLLLGETKNMTDEQLRREIESIASDLGASLTDTQISQLISLCRSLEKLNPEQLKEKVESVQNTIAKLGQAKETVSNFFEGVKNVWNSIVDFFKGLFA